MTTNTNTPEELAAEIKRLTQEFASAWSLVGSRFDSGDGLETAEDVKSTLLAAIDRLRDMASAAQAGAGEPLFLLHTGKLDSDGEQDEWDIEADSGVRVDEFCAKHPCRTIGLYARPAPAPAARKPLEWQPIETAPKDGTEFLAWFQKHKLDEDNESTDEVVGGAQAITSFTGGYWNEPDWLDGHGPCFMEDWVFAEAPILWQPLPKPPAGTPPAHGIDQGEVQP